MVGGAQCHTLGVVKSVPVEYTETMASQQLQQSTVLQVKDVYDIAQSVGEQFQVLIQHFGISYLGELVNTVVDALEHLETYVQDNQKLQTRVVKVLLDNDNLIKENELLKAESQKNAVSIETNIFSFSFTLPKIYFFTRRFWHQWRQRSSNWYCN